VLDLSKLITEARNKKTMELDKMTPLEIAGIMNEEDFNVVSAIREVLPQVAKVIAICTDSLNAGGRIIYIGAGTSGRLGLLDAVECPPTFGVSPHTVVGLLAGGESAFIKAVEGAEDSETLGRQDLININLEARDTVIGLTASGRTPYVVHALRYAKEIGCPTAIIACNKDSEMAKEADHAIEPVVGPEVLTGSTRLKAGTAQKMILNMISTGSMVGNGKVYQNLMVDVMQTNEKLMIRAQNIVMAATGCSRQKAAEMLKETNGSVKSAITAILLNCNVEEANEKLAKAGGHVRKTFI